MTLGLASGLDLRIVFEVKAGKSSEDGALDLLVATRSGAAAGALSLSVPEPGAAALLAVGLLACALARPRRTGARDRGLA